MTIPTIFETSRPRDDVLRGAIAEADFAADLAQVVAGRGGAEYLDPARFFARTYPTRGLRDLLANVGRRLTGAGGEAAAIFRLDTSYGGGKTHGLIALVHAARGMRGVANVAEFVEPALVPAEPVRIAAFDGENADPANGRAMGEGVLAHTPWGEIAYALAGRAGYERVRVERRAPGGARRRDPAGAVRRRAGPDPARRALGVPAQGAPLRRRPRPVDRLPDLAVQGGGGCAERGAGLYPRDRQGRAGRRCVQRGEPVHRRPDGGGGERVGAQGDAAQSDRGGRDGPGPAPAPVRGDRRSEGPGP